MGSVANVDEESLDEIVLIVSQGNLLTVEVSSLPKEGCSSESGTEETRVFAVFGTVGPESIVRCDDSVVKTFLVEEGL